MELLSALGGKPVFGRLGVETTSSGQSQNLLAIRPFASPLTLTVLAVVLLKPSFAGICPCFSSIKF